MHALDDREMTSSLLVLADMPVIRERTIRLVGPLTAEVHRQVKRPSVLPPERRSPTRMPSLADEFTVFVRDGMEMPVLSNQGHFASSSVYLADGLSYRNALAEWRNMRDMRRCMAWPLRWTT
ncbi:hypothetical protein [Piscinibacter koreensis]|uniref:hypothetical protein n=1 Tax=Piscinibacter koreensis TaxID=2742824 RepID=UPI0015928E58|nr:hypothetical protein [Schlegelella koreensis]